MLQQINPQFIDNMVQKVDPVRGTPWEDMGYELPANASVEETLKLAGLDWGVIKRPAWVDASLDADGETLSSPMKIPGNHVLLRDDTMEPIGPFVGERYKPIQNDEAFNVFRDFCDAGNMVMETAGSIFNGQHIWGLARIRGDYELVDGEVIRGYFLLMQSHVYGSALKAQFTPIRFPGGHTLVQPVKRSEKSNKAYTMSHSRVFNQNRIDDIKEVIGVAEKVLLNFVDEARILTDTPVDEAETVLYFIETFHPSLFNRIKRGLVDNIPVKVSELADWENSNLNLRRVPSFMEDYSGSNLSTCQGTAWGVLQATNYAFDHVIGHKSDTRLTSAWMGEGAKSKLKALARVKNLGGKKV